MKTVNSNKYSFIAAEEKTIDLDALGVVTIKVKYKNMVYKINLEKLLKNYGIFEKIVFDSNK